MSSAVFGSTIDPAVLDVVKRDHDFVLYYAGQPLRVAPDREVAAPQARLLAHIARDLALRGHPAGPGSHALALFTALPPDSPHPLLQVAEQLEADPFARRIWPRARRAAAEWPDSAADAAQVAFFLDGVVTTVKCLNDYLLEISRGHFNFIAPDAEEFRRVISAALAALAPLPAAAVAWLAGRHGAGHVAPLLLVARRITPAEYAHTLFSLCPPGSAVPAPADGLRPNWSRPDESFQALRAEAADVLDYLACAEKDATPSSQVRELVAAGEGFYVEFKSTLRWNIKAARKDPDIEHAALKTIAAFLNSAGGALVVGVNDTGQPEGLDHDQFPTQDRMALHFWNLVKSSMGQDVAPLIRATFEPLADKTVLLIQCARSPRPVFLRQSGFDEEFFIRVGPASSKLSIQEALKYIATRFGPAE